MHIGRGLQYGRKVDSQWPVAADKGRKNGRKKNNGEYGKAQNRKPVIKKFLQGPVNRLPRIQTRFFPFPDRIQLPVKTGLFCFFGAHSGFLIPA
jgi:hypothetical protein